MDQLETKITVQFSLLIQHIYGFGLKAKEIKSK